MNNTELVYLPVSSLYPHPDNPRKDLGDLSELSDSIKTNGIYQNLTVVPGHTLTEDEWKDLTKEYQANPNEETRTLMNSRKSEDGYTIIIGHRRLAAAKLAGLEKVPCVIADMDKQQQVRTMLLENMQRSDLTVYEQAQGFQMLLDFGASIEEIANKSGFSTTTVRRRIKMCELDQNKLKRISSERQLSLTDFDELAKIENVEARNKVLEKLGTSDFKYAMKEALCKQAIDKVWPEALEMLNALKAKEVRSADTWGGNYEQVGKAIDLTQWETTKENIPESTKDKLYYTTPSCWGDFRIYKKRHVEKAPQKTEKQIQREMRMKEAWQFVTEQSALMYEMRSEFIQSFNVTSKNEKTVLQGLLYRTIMNTMSYMYCDKGAITKLLGLEDSAVYSHDKDFNLYNSLDDFQISDMAKFVYYSFEDKKENLFINSLDYRHSNFPVYDPNGKLLVLYKWLELIGYEMSGIEKSLLDGTHQIYTTWKEESASLSEALS